MPDNVFNQNRILLIVHVIINILDYFVAFLIVIMTGCGWAYDANLNLSIAEMYTYLQNALIISVIIILISAAVIYDSRGKYAYDKTSKKGIQGCERFRLIHISNSRKIRAIIVILIILTYSFYNRVNVKYFNTRHVFVFLWMMLWLLLHEDKKAIWKQFVNIVVAIAIISLFFYFFGTVFNIVPEYNTSKRLWGDWKPQYIRNFYYLYYESHLLRIGDTILWRNVGCFAEGPMYNFVLCAALAAEIFICNSKYNYPYKQDQDRRRISLHSIKTIILIITIITTISTTGFIFLAITGAICLMQNAERFKSVSFLKRHIRLFVFAMLIVLIGFVLIKMLSPNGRGSLSVRTDHLFACIEAFLRKPIMGCGWGNLIYIYRFVEYEQGLSVGLPSFMAYGGLLLSGVLFIPLLMDLIEINGLQRINVENREAIKNEYLIRINSFIFECLFLLLFFFTIVNSYPILWFFIAYITVNNPCEKMETMEYA